MRDCKEARKYGFSLSHMNFIKNSSLFPCKIGFSGVYRMEENLNYQRIGIFGSLLFVGVSSVGETPSSSMKKLQMTT